MKKYFLKIILIIIMAFAAIFFFTKSIKCFLHSYPAFKIKEIEVRYTLHATRFTPEEIRKILDIDEQSSIFFLDLKEASQRLEQKAEIKKAVVWRQFPNKLIIRLERRIPLAQIHNGRYFLVDEEGVILPESQNFSFSSFPLLKGIKLQKGEIKTGKRCSSQQLNNGLALIKFLSLFPEFKIKEINTENIQNISLYLQIARPNLPLWSGKSVLLKIKSSPWNNEERDTLQKKIKLLFEILPFHQPQDIRYIDLRFEDIVVKKK